MFLPLAWLRAVLLSFFLLSTTTSSYAREESICAFFLPLTDSFSPSPLDTSSITYCDPPSTLLISRFEVAYFPHNSSIAFNISAASVVSRSVALSDLRSLTRFVQQSTNVSASLYCNIYGIEPFNLTVDLCDGKILSGALCPLPKYNFTGSQVLTIPSSIDVTSRIPAIGFKIPDLEGFAQLTLTDVNTGSTRACVQATIANGWSMHQPAVEWATGGIAIAGALAAFGMSLWFTGSIVPFRFLDLMSLYQFIATSALLSLNYPSAYRAFALNLAWSIGLFPSVETSAIQRSIDKMRHRTGSRLPDESLGSAIQYVNRKLSPYNLDPRSVFPRAGTVRGGEVQTVTSSSSNVLQAGLPIYVNSVHVPIANAFMTVFICALIFFAIGLCVLAIGCVIGILRHRKTKSPLELTRDYLPFARSWILRYVSFREDFMTKCY